MNNSYKKDLVIQKPLEEVMHESMMPYANTLSWKSASKGRDGLKPVQKDHLYTMHELGVTRKNPIENLPEL